MAPDDGPAGAAEYTRTWQDIWASRSVPLDGAHGLADLIAADGYDNSYGAISEQRWRDHAARWAGILGVRSGDVVYEVGCGAGAFLACFREMGCAVGGLDVSGAMIRLARRAIPDGDFRVSEATGLDGVGIADVVVANGSFLYFPSLEYAHQVTTAMVRAARRAVAILDLPDETRRLAAIAARQAEIGAAEYARRYASLDHRYFSRQDMARYLSDLGCAPVWTDDVRIEGYGNAGFRFDLIGFKAAVDD
ncbi:MAG: class I SAM-dependent methyltransferase [Streptosporangiaceae bacterium]